MATGMREAFPGRHCFCFLQLLDVESIFSECRETWAMLPPRQPATATFCLVLMAAAPLQLR